MRVVVVGGTGFLGRHISAALSSAGHAVSVLSRDPARAASMDELKGVTAIRADVTIPASLRGAFDGADAVVGCVQFPNHPIEVPRRGLTYDAYDHIGTLNLLSEAVRAGVKRYFYLSGAGADATSKRSWYRAKGRAESAIKKSGLEFCILRPSWAYGPGDRALNRIASIARMSPIVVRLGVSEQKIQPVFVGDIAEVVRRAFADDDAWGRTLEIGSPDVMTMDEVTRTLIDVLGLRRIILPIPIPLAKLATAPLRALPNPPMTPPGIEFATQDGLVDISELVSRLDVRPRTLREGLTEYMTPKKSTKKRSRK